MGFLVIDENKKLSLSSNIYKIDGLKVKNKKRYVVKIKNNFNYLRMMYRMIYRKTYVGYVMLGTKRFLIFNFKIKNKGKYFLKVKLYCKFIYILNLIIIQLVYLQIIFKNKLLKWLVLFQIEILIFFFH